VHESHLARLRYSLLIFESSGSKKFCAVPDLVEKPAIHEEAAARGSSSAFARHAVDHDDVLFIFEQPLVHFFDKRNQNMKRRSVVVLPIIISDAIIETCTFIDFFGYVEYFVFFGVAFVQKSLHFFSVIPICSFNSALARIRHYNYSVEADIAKVKVKVTFFH
jgi:hypothetical protein